MVRSPVRFGETPEPTRSWLFSASMRPAVGVHVLRHSAAARVIGAGGSAKTLQAVLGHRSAAFSLTVYGHLFDADLDALADRLDKKQVQ